MVTRKNRRIFEVYSQNDEPHQLVAQSSRYREPRHRQDLSSSDLKDVFEYEKYERSSLAVSQSAKEDILTLFDTPAIKKQSDAP